MSEKLSQFKSFLQTQVKEFSLLLTMLIGGLLPLTFINPLEAMGHMFYILYRHLCNSWSIYQFERKRA